MSVEDEIRRIVNEELDRRMKEDNLRKIIEEGEIGINDARKRMGYSAVPVPEGTDARMILDGEWVDNSVAMPEPEVPWQERHDRKTYISETLYGDVTVTTVPENRCRWCNELIASEGDFWYHLESRVAGCEGWKRIAEPKEEN